MRINTVVPGPTETPGLTGLLLGDPAALLQQIAAGVPRPMFLVSDQSSGMTGSEVVVDGGVSIAA